MAVTAEPLTPSNHLPLDPSPFPQGFGATPGFFSAEFNALNPFDADFNDATASPMRVEQSSSGAPETPPLPYASYQQDMPRSVTESAMRRNYDPSLVPTPGPRVNPLRPSALKESTGPEDFSNTRLPPSPGGSPGALNPALLNNESGGYPPSYPLPPPAHSAGLGSSRGIHGEVTPPTDNASSPDAKSTNGKSSQPRKGSNSRKRKATEAEIPEIKVERVGTPSDYNSNFSTPQPDMGDDKGSFSSGTQDSKRKKFLERNRLAASKCRQKKKEWASHLEEQARYQAQENKILRASVAQLRDECLYLKNFLLSTHSGCQCVGVKNYLMKEAQLSQQVAAGIAGGVMPIAGMIHPGYAMMGMGPPQYGIEMPGDRRRSGSITSGPTQGSMSPQQ